MRASTTILIVERSRTQAELLKLVLQTGDYTVLVATTSSDALALAREQQPALILSGVALGGPEGLSGYDLCATLKQDETLQHIPVALLTALSDVDDLLHCLKSRVDYCIAKPYQEEELLARIAAIIAGLARTVEHDGQEAIEVPVRGQHELFTTERQQLARLLLSTYENYGALLRQHRSLSTSQLQIKTQHQQLQAEYERLSVELQNAQEAANAAPPPADSAASEEPADRSEQDTNLVLLADDTAAGRTLLTRFLEKLGYQVNAVSNGIDAVKLYETHRYAAVVMDAHLPALDGCAATQQIRQHAAPLGRHVPIIAVTRKTHPDEGAKCLAAGADDYLTKPVTLAALQRALAPRLQPVSAGDTDVAEPLTSATQMGHR
jgi:CheY-like chemotaxis protein